MSLIVEWSTTAKRLLMYDFSKIVYGVNLTYIPMLARHTPVYIRNVMRGEVTSEKVVYVKRKIHLCIS